MPATLKDGTNGKIEAGDALAKPGGPETAPEPRATIAPPPDEGDDHQGATRDGYSLYFSFMAVLIALAALLAVAFKLDSNQNATAGPSPSQIAASMPQDSGAGPTVNVELGDFFVRSSTATIRSGTVTFAVRNGGQVPHDLAVARTPVALDASGNPSASATAAALGMTQESLGGADPERLTLELRPGAYELYCDIPGHYPAGQHTKLTVTKD